MTREPTILLGVGATKAGTSWLHAHLAAHPDCHLRAIKELHYFDTLENRAFGHQIRVQQGFADQLAARLATAPEGRAAAIRQRLDDVTEWLALLQRRAEDLPAYLAYLTRGRGERRLVGDITPAYALLPVPRLRAMAGMAADVRFVYLMRDPVARLWSHVRMLAARTAADAASLPATAFALMERILDGQSCEMTAGAAARGDYAGAITRLRAAVDPSRLLLMLQEEMVTPPGLARLAAFLGLRGIAADFGRRVHEGPTLALSPEHGARARVLLAPQYRFVARQFPALPESWRRNMDMA